MEDERVESALLAAYEVLSSILEPVLEGATTFFAVTISVDYDEKGPSRLVFEIVLPRSYDRVIGQLLGEAVNEAARAFEEKLGIKVGRGVRLIPIEPATAGSSGYSAQERGSRRRRRGGGHS